MINEIFKLIGFSVIMAFFGISINTITKDFGLSIYYQGYIVGFIDAFFLWLYTNYIWKKQ